MLKWGMWPCPRSLGGLSSGFGFTTLPPPPLPSTIRRMICPANRLLMRSKAAIARLRAYRPPEFTLWDDLPASRRAAVLILLYADRKGDLRVVLTMRSAKMRSFSGHAAFPGGKADSTQETPYEVARREAWEEIGLQNDDSKIPPPFRIQFLCHLPHNMARNDLVVRPCVALLDTTFPLDHEPSPLVEETMIPKLHAHEVAAVFTAPFRDFLRSSDPSPLPDDNHNDEGKPRRPLLPPGHWYDGSWIYWQNHPWRVHNFYVPVNSQLVVKPPPEEDKEEDETTTTTTTTRKKGVKVGQAGDDAAAVLGRDVQDDAASAGRYKVWGLTAKILVDTAIIAYGKRPEMEHNDMPGDETIIQVAAADGRFFDKSKV